MNRRQTRVHLTLLALYATLAIALTWPLARHITTHVAGNGIDDPALAWNLWWVKARLIDQLNPDIFHANWMFFPIDINLGFYTLTPLNGLLSVPLQTAANLIFTSNILLYLSYIIGGYGTYLLSLTLLRQQSNFRLFHIRCAAAVAGTIDAFASSKLFYAALGQFNIASSHWIPFCVLYLLRMHPRYRAKDIFLAGLFLVFQAWSELTYASFLLIFIGVYFVWLQIPRQPIAKRLQRTGHFILLGIIFVVGIAPFLWAMVPDLLAEGDFFASGGGFADQFSADLFGYLGPTLLHPFWGNWVDNSVFGRQHAQQITIGYVGLGLAILGTVVATHAQRTTSGRPPVPQTSPAPNPRPPIPSPHLFWIFNLLFFWLLTLGPFLRWRGENIELFGLPIPGPFWLISQLPFFSGNRYPSRYSVMLMLCVAVLAAFGVAWILGRSFGGGARKSSRPNIVDRPDTRSGGSEQAPSVIDASHPTSWPYGVARMTGCIMLSVVIIALFLLEHLSVPLWINDSRTPPIYETIRQTPGDFTVLELPTGWRNGAYVLGKSDELIMMQQWYQIVHGKRRLGGNTSRNPSYKFEYFVNAPLIGDLIALMNADQAHVAAVVERELPEMIARNRVIAPQVLDSLDVRYVTLDVARSPQPLVDFVEASLPVTLVEEWAGDDWRGQPQQIRLYQVDALAPADPQTEQHGKGWTIRMSDEDSSLFLAEGWAALAADGARFATRASPSLLLDIAGSGGTLTVDIEGFGLRTGSLNAVRFGLNGLPLDAQCRDGACTMPVPAHAATRPLDRLTIDFGDGTAMESRSALSYVAMSAGKDVGDYTRIFVNGKDVAQNKRGYNLVAFSSAGEVLDSVVFDTHDAPNAPTQSAEMAAWLAKWPDGTLIAGAARDEASRQLGEDAVQALQQIGVAGDLRGRHRWSHAFIGSAGGSSASESIGLLKPAAASVGTPLTSERIYGALETVTFKPVD